MDMVLLFGVSYRVYISSDSLQEFVSDELAFYDQSIFVRLDQTQQYAAQSLYANKPFKRSGKSFSNKEITS